MKSSLESELVWFFDDARGALGLSGLNPEPTSKSVGLAPEGISENARFASAKYRKIDSAYKLLSSQHRNVLWFAYQPMTPAYAQLVGVFGKFGAVALVIKPLSHWQDWFCVSTKKPIKSTKPVSDLKTQIDQMHQSAIKAYKQARKKIDAEADELRRLRAIQWVTQ